MTKTDLKTAIVELARGKAEPGQPVNLYDIGPTLIVDMGFDEQEVLNTIFALQDEGVIRLIGDNRIVVVA